MTIGAIVGRNDGKPMPTGDKRREFSTVAEAESFVGDVLDRLDHEGVLRGDYYVDDMAEIQNVR